MFDENVVLCVSNSYEKKYYFNPDFDKLPDDVKNELKIMCVLFTEEVGGILDMEFDEEGNLLFKSSADEGDLLYDEIAHGAVVVFIGNLLVTAESSATVQSGCCCP